MSSQALVETQQRLLVVTSPLFICRSGACNNQPPQNPEVVPDNEAYLYVRDDLENLSFPSSQDNHATALLFHEVKRRSLDNVYLIDLSEEADPISVIFNYFDGVLGPNSQYGNQEKVYMYDALQYFFSPQLLLRGQHLLAPPGYRSAFDQQYQVAYSANSSPPPPQFERMTRDQAIQYLRGLPVGSWVLRPSSVLPPAITWPNTTQKYSGGQCYAISIKTGDDNGYETGNRTQNFGGSNRSDNSYKHVIIFEKLGCGYFHHSNTSLSTDSGWFLNDGVGPFQTFLDVLVDCLRKMSHDFGVPVKFTYK